MHNWPCPDVYFSARVTFMYTSFLLCLFCKLYVVRDLIITVPERCLCGKTAKVAPFLQITVNIIMTTSALVMMMMINSGKVAPKPAPSPHTSYSAMEEGEIFLT